MRFKNGPVSGGAGRSWIFGGNPIPVGLAIVALGMGMGLRLAAGSCPASLFPL